VGGWVGGADGGAWRGGELRELAVAPNTSPTAVASALAPSTTNSRPAEASRPRSRGPVMRCAPRPCSQWNPRRRSQWNPRRPRGAPWCRAPTSPTHTRPTRYLNPLRRSAERPIGPGRRRSPPPPAVPSPGRRTRRLTHTGGQSTRCCPAPAPATTGGHRSAQHLAPRSHNRPDGPSRLDVARPRRGHRRG
jgi:hypothetical protein